MVYRHSLVTRITHVTFSVCFLILALSGAQIFLHAHWIHVKTGVLHEFCGLGMILSGAVYLASGIRSGELGKLIFLPADTANVVPMAAYYMRLRGSAPAYSDYNPLQKLAYTIVLLLIGPAIAATGLAMWLRLGGRGLGILHLGLAVELVLFFFGHMLMVATTGVYNNLRSMVTGWYRPSVTA